MSISFSKISGKLEQMERISADWSRVRAYKSWAQEAFLETAILGVG